MNSILTYDTITDTWQMMNAVGEIPEGRTKHTTVSTSDGRVILFGGISNALPALPHLSTLDTSKIPYEWSTPTIENPIGSFSEHTAVIVKNYMIFAFGKNESATATSDNKAIYKLDVSDPLKYKWSLLSRFDNSSTLTGAPVQTNVSAGAGSLFESRIRLIIIIVVIIVVFICISILVFYKIKQYKNKKNENEETYQQNSNELDISQ